MKVLPVNCDTNEVHLRLIGDIHYGARSCKKDLVIQEIEDIKSDPLARVIVLGDIINNNTKSAVGSVFEDEIPPYQQELEAVEMLRPIADKIDIWVNGNHERRSGKDTSIDICQDMALRLGVENKYVGAAGFVRYILPNPNNAKGRSASFTFLVTHGSGGGKKPGSGINNAVDYAMGFDGIDGLFMGHTHKPDMHPDTKVRVTANGAVVDAPMLVVVCASWQGYDGYPVYAMMRPSVICRQIVTLKNETNTPRNVRRIIEGSQSFIC